MFNTLRNWFQTLIAQITPVFEPRLAVAITARTPRNKFHVLRTDDEHSDALCRQSPLKGWALVVSDVPLSEILSTDICSRCSRFLEASE